MELRILTSIDLSTSKYIGYITPKLESLKVSISRIIFLAKHSCYAL